MTVLSVQDLSVAFAGKEVVRNVSFTVNKGKTLAIVGESGSGKSVTSSAVMGLLRWLGGRVTSGEIWFQHGEKRIDLSKTDDETLRHLRGKEIAMIFQEYPPAFLIA